MSKRTKGNLLLLLTSFIWGSAFVAQSSGMDYVGPYTYNMARNVLAFLFLIPVIYVIGKKKGVTDNAGSGTGIDEAASGEAKWKSILLPDRTTLVGGIYCGLVMAVASSLQQIGITMTTAGKAGFITALYIILVPLMGVFIGKKIPRIIWFCVVLAMAGFYLLCVKEGFSISKGDILVLFCSVGFSVHIMTIDHFTSKGVDGVKMACIQFAVAAIVMTPVMFLLENPSVSGLLSAWMTIAYAGILSSGVGFTLQIVAQKDTDPTTATLIMSLESVFAAVSGCLFLNEVLLPKEILGCILVFVAVILAQVPLPVKSKEKRTVAE
nr:DMT family transporter [uncultured Mogibacterium sp.]